MKTLNWCAPAGSAAALAVLTLVFLLTGCDAGWRPFASESVTIATVASYHPFNFVNDEGLIDGLERELGDELCRRAELDCEWTINEWEEMIPDLMAGEFDLILSGMSITAGRDELIDFSESYYPPAPSVYLVAAGAGDAAAAGTIGAKPNTIYSDFFDSTGQDYHTLPTELDSAEAVLSGRVDTVLVDHGYAVARIQEHGGRLDIAGEPVLLDRGLGIGVREGSALKEKLDKALREMKSDGSLNAIIRKWVGDAAATY